MQQDNEIRAQINALAGLLRETDFLLLGTLERLYGCDTTDALLEVIRSEREKKRDVLAAREAWREQIDRLEAECADEEARVDAIRASIPDIAQTEEANGVIAILPYLDNWNAQAYQAGDTVLWEGQPMTCVQAHDASRNTNWTPDSAPSLWRPWHATEPEFALPWRQPLGAHDAYMTGEYMLWGAEDAPVQAWQCLFDSVVHTPGDRPDAWLVWEQAGAEDGQEGPAEGDGDTGEPVVDEYPAWVQPTGAHDAYAAGAVVSHGGQVWRNTADGNAHAPGVWGWEVVA